MKRVLIIAGMMLASMTLFAQSGARFLDNVPWNEVMRQAKKADKMIFVDCYTTWCGPCKQLATEIFPQEKMGKYLNERFVCVKYDVEHGEGLVFAEKYPDVIKSYPTLLVIDTEGRLIHKVVGCRPAYELIAAIDAGLKGRTIYTLKREFEEGNREWGFICEYLRLLDKVGEEKQYEAVARAYASRYPLDSLLNPDIWGILGYFVTQDPYSEDFRFTASHLDEIQARGLTDRYGLEQKLSREMMFAVNGLRINAFRTENADTLAELEKQAEQLRQVLRLPVKGFAESMATLAMIECRIGQDVDGLYDRFRVLADCGFVSDDLFLIDVLEYLVLHLDDASRLREVLAYASRLKTEGSRDSWVQEGYDEVAKLGKDKLKTITK